jgi:hypothetical protein
MDESPSTAIHRIGNPRHHEKSTADNLLGPGGSSLGISGDDNIVVPKLEPIPAGLPPGNSSVCHCVNRIVHADANAGGLNSQSVVWCAELSGRHCADHRLKSPGRPCRMGACPATTVSLALGGPELTREGFAHLKYGSRWTSDQAGRKGMGTNGRLH